MNTTRVYIATLPAGFCIQHGRRQLQRPLVVASWFPLLAKYREMGHHSDELSDVLYLGVLALASRHAHAAIFSSGVHATGPALCRPCRTWFPFFLLTQGLRPGLHSVAALRLGLGELNAALKRRSSTSLRASVMGQGQSKIKVNVKSSGQECPLHTCNINCNVKNLRCWLRGSHFSRSTVGSKDARNGALHLITFAAVFQGVSLT
jgi:hypothetical protein